MHLLSQFLLIISCLVFTIAAQAQRRSVGDVLLVPEIQTELALQGDDYLLATFNLVLPTNGTSNSTFAGGQLRLGYEHFWNERWSWGGTLRIIGGETQGYGDLVGLAGDVAPGLLLRHSGKIGSLNFGQRLGLEYTMTFKDTRNLGGEDRALTRLRFDVDRLFSLGERLAIRPRIAYEIATYLRLQRDEDELKERVIDFGSLRAELGLRLSPRFDFTPWVASQTIYSNFLPQYDATGNQTSGGRTNSVFPLVGFDARLTLLGGNSAERRQLPTQH